MHEPELLILDEPIAGLDALVQWTFHELLREGAEGRTVVLSSHTRSEVDRVADRAAILRRGKLVVVDRLGHLRSLGVRRRDIEFAQPPNHRRVSGDPRSHRRGHGGAAPRQLRRIGRRRGRGGYAHEVVAIRSRADELEVTFLRWAHLAVLASFRSSWSAQPSPGSATETSAASGGVTSGTNGI
jgi:ABC-2 type transport system ATP-binding protein